MCRSPALNRRINICQINMKAYGMLSKIVFAAVYCSIITPAGFFMKISGIDPLSRWTDKANGSYWIKRRHIAATKRSLERPF